MLLKNLAQLSKVCRNRRKLSQLSLEEVAAFTRLSPRLIGEFERNQRDSVAFKNLNILLQLLGLTLLIGNQPAAHLQRTIKQARKSSGLTQVDTALLLDISFTTYKRLEQGANVATDTVFQACNGLGIPWELDRT